MLLSKRNFIQNQLAIWKKLVTLIPIRVVQTGATLFINAITRSMVLKTVERRKWRI